MLFSTRTAPTLFLLVLASSASATYTLTDDYSQDTFFGNFTAFTSPDPTHGFVNYVDYETATANKLIQSVPNANSASYIGVDASSDTNTGGSNAGRNSMRLTSQKAWTHGLFVVDLLHMPGNTCGTWPAFWLVGPSWPNNGEIDIIEGVNDQAANQMTLHTSSGCSIPSSSASSSSSNTTFAGKVDSTNCGPNQANQGCAISSTSATPSFGDAFNAANGGVFATEWTSQGISIWFFPRSSIPSDITNDPDPASWPAPQAHFPNSASCSIDSHFQNMNLVFNTAFCGDWAGNVWTSGGCAASTGVSTCDEYVAKNPKAFEQSFWLVNYLKVFQEDAQQQGAQQQKRNNEEEDMTRGMRWARRG